MPRFLRLFQSSPKGSAFLNFQRRGTIFDADYFTPVNVTPGTLTAGYVGKISTTLFGKTIWLPVAGRCALAGADNVVLQQNQAVADEQTYRAGDCVVAFRVNSEGKVIPGTINLIDGDVEKCPISTPAEELTPLLVDAETPYVFPRGN